MKESARSSVLLRRWLAVGAVLLVGLTAGSFGWKSTSVWYESSGVVLVIPPGAGNPDARNNPFNRLDTTSQFANALAVIAYGDEGRATVAKTGASSSDYTVFRVAGQGPTSSQLSAQIRISVRGPGPWVAREGAMALIDLMRTRLRSLQRDAGLVDGTYADFRVTVEPDPGEAGSGDRVRSAVGMAIGAVLALLCVAAAGAAMRARSAASRASSAADAEREPVPA